MAEMPVPPPPPRQRQVLQLAADGLTAYAIARQLGISQRTVHAHLAAVMRRYAAVNTTQAVAQALRLGVIE